MRNIVYQHVKASIGVPDPFKETRNLSSVGKIDAIMIQAVDLMLFSILANL
jgi:hypothetical protein